MKKSLISSLGCLLCTIAFSQNNPPVAVSPVIRDNCTRNESSGKVRRDSIRQLVDGVPLFL